MKIGIIGAGRLGICFALLCESVGYDVLVSDIREDYVKDLNNKRIKTNEPEVEDLLKSSKNFKATTNNKEVIKDCDVIYIFVDTPSLQDGSYDVSSVRNVIKDIKEELIDIPKIKYLVIGCTTNPGDCETFRKELPKNIKVFYNPEFIAQGSIISDLRNADIVLFGADPFENNKNIVYEIKNLYKKIQTKEPIVCVMSIKASEITKIAVNCFLTTKISYANMLGDVLHKADCGDEVNAVLAAVGTDARIGRKYLNYGFGYGGPCLPRDNRSFAAFAKKVGLEYNLGIVTDNINKEHAKFVCDYYEKMNQNNLPYYFDYITYKKGTDILTESQQFRLCLDLLDRNHSVYILRDERVVEQIGNYLTTTYGNKVTFVDNKDNIKEPFFIVSL